MDTEIKHTSRKVVDTKMGGTLDFFQGTEALQRDLDRLESWAILNCIHLKRCRILYLEWGNPGCTCKLRIRRLESSCEERLLGFWVNRKSNLSQQCPGRQKGQPSPGVHQAQHCWTVEAGDYPSLFSARSPLL